MSKDIIERLNLQPHPEGGWYRETFRDVPGADGRSRFTVIYFLLEADQKSQWHRVDASEVWLWHSGAPVKLVVREAGQTAEITMGPDIDQGHQPQAIVPKNTWQMAEPMGGWALVSCVVSPGFEFDGFELAPEGWEPN